MRFLLFAIVCFGRLFLLNKKSSAKHLGAKHLVKIMLNYERKNGKMGIIDILLILTINEQKCINNLPVTQM